MIDVDGLKAVNDEHGHRAGDQALKVIAGRLRRTGGIVGRYGGDEFLVIFQPHDCLDGKTPDILLRQALADAFTIDSNGSQISVSASFGIAGYPDQALDLAALVEQADAAMYQQKRQKRQSARQGHVAGPFRQPVGPHAA